MTARVDMETTVAIGREDSVVRIYTSDTVHLRRLRKLVNSRDFVREVAGGDDWGQFEVDAESFRLFSAIRAKRALSEADRAARVERLDAARVLRRPSRVDELLRERDG